jgi:hypothetical protein
MLRTIKRHANVFTIEWRFAYRARMRSPSMHHIAVHELNWLQFVADEFESEKCQKKKETCGGYRRGWWRWFMQYAGVYTAGNKNVYV